MQEMRVWTLGQKESLEKEMAAHSCILAWEIPWIGWVGQSRLAGYCLWGHKTVQYNLVTTTNKAKVGEFSFSTSDTFSSVQSQFCLTVCGPMDCSIPGFPVHHQLPELAQTHVHWVGDAIQPSHPCCPFLFLPSIFPSIRVFSNESALPIRWPKYWSFSFSISPSNEYSGLISFRISWFDLLEVQGTLKSLLQHHSSKASIHQHSAFFMVQLSHLYMTTGKTIPLI